jgi:phosphate transport system permease protein
MPSHFSVSAILNDPAVIRRRRWRMLKDKIARHSMTLGGISVIGAILLIFFYLLYVVFPLFVPANITEANQFTLPVSTTDTTLYLAIEEKNEIGVRFTEKAQAIFFDLSDGHLVKSQSLPIPPETTITSFAVADSATQVIAFGLSDGRAIVAKHAYDVTYPEGGRHISPKIVYPFGEEAFVVDKQGQALTKLSVQVSEDASTLVAVTPDNRLVLAGVTKTTNFLDDSVTLEKVDGTLLLPEVIIKQLLLDKMQNVLYLVDNERIWQLDVRHKARPQLVNQVRIADTGQSITAATFLAGDTSLLIGDSSGKIAQWFPVQNVLTQIRQFDSEQTAITAIFSEERRRGFVAMDDSGQIGIYHSTAHRTLLTKAVSDSLKQIALSPRADVLLTEKDNAHFQVWHIHNEHPEVSWSALWRKVWYENHDQPKYIWQSFSASNDFEPKFSLMPLAFGTLKAAFYAMLVAVPLAILGAMYTAYFMAPTMRSFVKPTIEIMEALPTVILGFLAGLWLAPFVEANLPGVILLFLITPLSIFAFAYSWQFFPKRITYRIPDGWQAALLIPTVVFIGWLSFALSYPLELWLFDGNMRQWLTSIGIDFDQRNALVVGIAMGLAVIPSIFSITEDAIFSVPKHLTSGSLALGATPWQTMLRVVILTASPGIFSAVMIGLGRAVGETMIVLMATGNAAVMDFSIFQGLRTLSANIAVEMPESEVNSTHFRVLFLSGLVLFLFTFFFNTIAEYIRQRLRRKYSSL